MATSFFLPFGKERVWVNLLNVSKKELHSFLLGRMFSTPACSSIGRKERIASHQLQVGRKSKLPNSQFFSFYKVRRRRNQAIVLPRIRKEGRKSCKKTFFCPISGISYKNVRIMYLINVVTIWSIKGSIGLLFTLISSFEVEFRMKYTIF